MSFLPYCACVVLLVTLAGCDGSGNTSQPPPPTTVDSNHRSNDQAFLKDLASGVIDTANQTTQAKNPPSAVEPPVITAPAGEPEPAPESEKKLRKAIAHAQAEGSRQTTWLQNRLNRRLSPVLKQLRAAEQKYKARQISIERGEPKLAKDEQRKVKHLERQASRIRLKLDRMSSRYTDAFLDMDPIARELRSELESIERKKTETRLAGIEKALQHAHKAMDEERRRAGEIEQDNRRLLARFNSFLTEVEQGSVSPSPLDTDPDLEKAEKRLISVWKPVHDLRDGG